MAVLFPFTGCTTSGAGGLPLSAEMTGSSSPQAGIAGRFNHKGQVVLETKIDKETPLLMPRRQILLLTLVALLSFPSASSSSETLPACHFPVV